ncbi:MULTISPECIES: hypothetical protein [Achromobacter]|uniref:hypothetical protein n=1 Tax=Achromobacter TaxID=222 RepID=UPI0023F850AD|nr:hypothetical protein [Achromobacter anxifer]MDF8364665.1 hypothetical protein [Achromobacter anxifer]
MPETNSSLNDLIARRDALTEKIAELKKGRSEAIKKIIAVMGRFAISIDEIQLALPSAAPVNARDTTAAKAPYTGKKRGRKPKGQPEQTASSGDGETGAGGVDTEHGAANPAAVGNPPASDLLQNVEAGAQASPSATDDATGIEPTASDNQAPTNEDAERSSPRRSGQASDHEANPIPSAAPSAD